MTEDVALGVVGRIGSGKTTLASELASRIGCPVASFGAVVRTTAEARGLDPTDRTVLQDVGNELIAEGWTHFVRAVLGQARYSSGPIVVDGIRHHGAIDTLRSQLNPTQLVVVAVEVGGDERRKRRNERGLESADIASADSHTNESEVEDVIRTADIVVPAGATIEEACSLVLGGMSQV